MPLWLRLDGEPDMAHKLDGPPLSAGGDYALLIRLFNVEANVVNSNDALTSIPVTKFSTTSLMRTLFGMRSLVTS
jgi:hypothetical protein